MNKGESIPPLSLKIVAGLFIFSGISSLIEILVSAIDQNININLGVINIFVGIGLLRGRSGWRTCALVLTWMALIITPVATVLIFSVSGSTTFTLFGQSMGHVSKLTLIPFIAGLYALVLWQYHVLMRPDVKALFQPKRFDSPEGMGSNDLVNRN